MIKLDRSIIASAMCGYKLKLEADKAKLEKSEKDVQENLYLLHDIESKLTQIDQFLANFPTGMVDYEFFAEKRQGL